MNPAYQAYLRLTRYYRTHGRVGTLRQFAKILSRTLFKSSFIVYYADLPSLGFASNAVQSPYKVEYITGERELSAKTFQELVANRDEQIFIGQLKQRFENGAYLWLLKENDTTIGFVWCITARTLQPYFFPLGNKDIHLFDNEILPQYRGKGMNPILINNILTALQERGNARAYIETQIWNEPEKHSLAKTSFKTLGKARKLHIGPFQLSIWYPTKKGNGGTQ